MHETIQNVSGTVNVKVQNKNLFDKNTMGTRIYRYLDSSGQWVSAQDSYSVAIPCEPNKTYTISHSYSEASIFRCAYITVEPIPETGTVYLYNMYRGTTDLSHTITTGDDASYLVFQGNASVMSDIINSLQVEEGSTATSYVAHQEQTVTLTLPTGMELCKIGNYKDEFVKSNNTWKIPNKILKIASYNGETITTDYISTTGELSTGATVYYVGSEDYIITDTTLKGQLDNLLNIFSYDGTTYISSSNEIAPIFEASALMKGGN